MPQHPVLGNYRKPMVSAHSDQQLLIVVGIFSRELDAQLL